MNYSNNNNNTKNRLCQSIETEWHIAQAHPQKYNNRLMPSFRALGKIREDERHYSEAERIYRRAFRVLQWLMKRNPEDYESDFVFIYFRLYDLYSDDGKSLEAKNLYHEAKITCTLAQEGYSIHDFDAAYHRALSSPLIIFKLDFQRWLALAACKLHLFIMDLFGPCCYECQ